MQTPMYDSILHTKSEAADGSGVVEKIELPITRWENIMGRPCIIRPSQLGDINGGEYFFMNRSSIVLSDSVFAACYPEFL